MAAVVVPLRPAVVVAEFLVRTAIDCLAALQALMFRMLLYHFVLHTHKALDAQKCQRKNVPASIRKKDAESFEDFFEKAGKAPVRKTNVRSS